MMNNILMDSGSLLCRTDSNTDIGMVIVDEGFGWWLESNDKWLLYFGKDDSRCKSIGLY